VGRIDHEPQDQFDLSAGEELIAARLNQRERGSGRAA